MNEIRAEELPEFQAWREQFEPPADTSAYISQKTSVTAATILSELFFPELISVRACILLASHYEPSNFDEWWRRTSGNPVAVERAINHLHIWDLFEPADEQEGRALDQVAHRIALGWRCSARVHFPDRDIEVAVNDEYGPTVIMNSRLDS